VVKKNPILHSILGAILLMEKVHAERQFTLNINLRQINFLDVDFSATLVTLN
jgi:hypothetical protein